MSMNRVDSSWNENPYAVFSVGVAKVKKPHEKKQLSGIKLGYNVNKWIDE